MHQYNSSKKKISPLKMKKMCPTFIENEKNVPFFLKYESISSYCTYHRDLH